MNRISFMLANYVARQVVYHMDRGWGQGSKATIAYFAPAETFGARFDEYLRDVREMGFDAIDMWTDILGPPFATPAHVEAAREALSRNGLDVLSYGGWFGSTPEEFTATCDLAVALGTTLLGGSTRVLEKDRAFVVRTLKERGLRLGLENHPETPDQMLAKIGDGGDGTLGTTVDTGWYGTQAVDAAEAIQHLAPHVFQVHLKDVREAGEHNTCRFGDGVVPVERCVRVLQQVGFTGPLSIEHEPELYDPSEEVADSLRMLRGWLNER